eukprot:TRINITY_DN9181_c0_g1_i6.p1 TRINITY_DN9181_c0_g1~~TRINITY_DN9181_c0_g1_i6.p1  ORF type:complete len:217 (-),score=10.80 TRINITY_DN9181_c0_g1_i6:200-850(-)
MLVFWANVFELHDEKDKWIRTAQYICKSLAWYFSQTGLDIWLVLFLAELASFLAHSRKLFRIGKWVDSFAAIWEISDRPSCLRRTLEVAKELSSAFYHFYEMMQWLHYTKLLPSCNKQLLDDHRNSSLLCRILVTIAILPFEYTNLSTAQKKASKCPESNLVITRFTRELIRHLCDLPLAANPLGLLPISLHDGYIGICGIVSSLIGIYNSKWSHG